LRGVIVRCAAQGGNNMKKIIKEVNDKLGIVQVTIADERWYVKETTDTTTGLPTFSYVPSVTWIAGHYPKGIAFYKWLADQGWDESQAIKQAAGDKGSKVHDAISAILRGEEVRIDSKFLNRSTEQFEELTLEECDCILSFVNWRKEVQPESIAWDVVVFSEKYGYAGMIDYICKIDGKNYIVDFKTSQQVWPEYELQVSAYKKPIESAEFAIDGFTDVADINLAVLQVGYRRNKAGYKWNEIEDKFPLFLAARQIWASETEGEAPKKKDYPIVLSPAAKQAPVEVPAKVTTLGGGKKIKRTKKLPI
jgi:hypothetical protein